MEQQQLSYVALVELEVCKDLRFRSGAVEYQNMARVESDPNSVKDYTHGDHPDFVRHHLNDSGTLDCVLEVSRISIPYLDSIQPSEGDPYCIVVIKKPSHHHISNIAL